MKTVLCYLHNTSDIEVFSKAQEAGEYGNPRVLVLYQGE